MKRGRRALFAVAVLAIGVVAWAIPRDRPSLATLAECRAIEGSIEVRTDSRLRADGVLEPGSRASCDHSGNAARLLLSVDDALGLVPRKLRPTHVVVHLDPAVPRSAAAPGPLETHVESRSVLVRGASVIDLEPSAWLHELAHLRARGARPRDRMARRVFDAVEEGVADYYAAAISGSARVGPRSSGRDLDRPPRVTPEYWVVLLQPRFDPHPLGWALAAELLRIERRPGPLLLDLLEGLSHPRPPEVGVAGTPAGVLRAFVMACPDRSREVIADAIERAFGLPLELERIER